MYIVDSHHKVLLAWARLRNRLAVAPRLLSLDHHTDTSKPFRRYFQKLNGYDFKSDVKNFDEFQATLLKEVDYRNPLSIQNSLSKLNNDEHIVLAIKSDIISSAFIIAHNASTTGLETYLEHKIACKSVSDFQQTSRDPLYRFDCDRVLESSFLKNSLEEFNNLINPLEETRILSEPFILDIDLDYFNTFKSVEPSDRSFFDMLLQNAALVTVATEPNYVQSCSIDVGLDSSQILEKLFLVPK